ncbi:MAG: hypothetical protein WAW88_12840 [Nocardioides sp.]
MTQPPSFPPPPEDPSSQGQPPPPPAPSYGSMPGMPPAPPMDAPYGVPAAPVSRPASIGLAAKLMKAAAAITVLSVLPVFFLRPQVAEAIREAAAKQNKALTPEELEQALNFGTVSAVGYGLLAIGLWLWMASANGKGKSWARIVSSVLFALNTLFFVAGLSQEVGTLNRVISVLTWLLSAFIIFLLYKRESSDYYAAMSRPRI